MHLAGVSSCFATAFLRVLHENVIGGYWVKDTTKKNLIKVAAVTLAVCCALFVCVMDTTAVSSTVTETIEKMTLEEKIGQMITVDIRSWTNEEYSGDFTEINDEAAGIISTYSIGGVILFSENLKNTEQIVKLTDGLQMAALNSKNKIPLIIATDQEGGEIARINTATSLPGNMALGANASKEDAYRAGSILGKELAALGINVDYAPSLDVNNNPQNPVIGLRSFSSDPNLVADLGVEMINGLNDNRVAAAVKHFPGHGDTATDSHYGLPLVNKSLKQLNATELVPFKKAIENGVDMVMTAHIQFPKIERETAISQYDGSEIYLPATLSKAMITTVLREKMGYNGVVTTDAMNMEAITQNFGVTQAAILAINAGVDNLLMPVSLTSMASAVELKSLIDNIAAAVNDGTIKEETINRAVQRILTLKENRGILGYEVVDVSEKLALAQTIVGSKENHKIENEISASAVTLVKNDKNILPFTAKKGDKVVLIGAYSNEMPSMEYAVTKMIAQKELPAVEYVTMYYNDGHSLESILAEVSTANFVVTLTEMNDSYDLSQDSLNTYIPTQILEYTNANNIKNVMVSVSKPYDVANYINAPAVLAAYGATAMNPKDANGQKTPTYTYGPNIPAAIEVVFGTKAPWGKLPVDIPTIYADGSMNTEELAYTIGHGLIYEGYIKTVEPVTTVAATEVEEVAVTDVPQNQSTIDKLLYSPLFWIAAAVVMFIITLIIVIAKILTKNNSKQKDTRRY